MTHTKPMLLSSMTEDFYEYGLLNIINVIPRELPNDERLFIEAIVYTAYGYFQSYSALEASLENLIDDAGKLAKISPKMNRELFTNAWQCVDAGYAILQICRTESAKRFISLEPDFKTSLFRAKKLRNYMDHLKDNFRNITKARGWFPLYGWLTVQFSPSFRDSSYPENETFLVNIGSTHIGDGFTIHSIDHIKGSVYSHLDNVKLHVKRGDNFNLSELLVEMAVGLNDFSMQIQQYLFDKIQRYDGGNGGVRQGWATATIKADFQDIKLDRSRIEVFKTNKVRFEKKLNVTNK